MKNLVSFAVATVTAFSTASSYAGQPLDDHILVTATRSEQNLENSLASATILTEVEIDRAQAQNLPELFDRIPGLDIDHSGGLGSNTSMRLRGTENDHVLVLIDGIRASSATSGTAALQHLPITQIERVELVRGPRSSLYGSDAIGGVVQIFTKKGSTGIKPYLDFSYGSHNTRVSQAGVRGLYGNTSYSLNGSYTESEGYDRTYDNNGADTDKDGYRESAVSANIQHEFTNGIEFALNYLRSEGNTELDGGNDSTDFINESRDLSISLPILDDLKLKAQIGRYRDKTTSFGFSPALFETSRNSAALQLDYLLAENHQLSLGYDYHNDEVSSTANFTESERDNHSWFVQYLAEFNQWRFEAGFRNDDNEAFGSHETGNIAVGFQVNEETLLSLSYGTAFKSPTFNDLYFPFTDFGCFFGTCFTFEGNPNLIPEESETVELMIRRQTGSIQWFASLYQTQIDDLISLSPDFSTVSNVAEAKIVGGEAGADFDFFGWRTAISVAYTDPRDESDDSLLIRRSRASANLDISRKFGKMDLTLYWQVQSYRLDQDKDFDGKKDRLSGYGTVDLRARYQVTETLRLAIKINNLFDKEYRLVQPFETDGVAAAISAHYAL